MGYLDVPVPVKKINRLAQYPWLPVASKAAYNYITGANQLSDGTTQGGTSRLIHQALCSFSSLKLAYGNWYNSTGDADGPNDITVGGAVEYANSGKPLPVTFGGANQVVIKPGGIAISDPVGIGPVSKGSFFETRTFVQVSAGNKFPLGSDLTSSGNGEGHNYPAGASVGADLTGTGAGSVTAVNQVRVYGPAALLGRPTYQPSSTVLIIGDSIATGVGETLSAFTDWGFIVRALNSNYPFMRLSFPGETPGVWSQNGRQGCFRRTRMVGLASFSHVICQNGINSISLGTSGLQSAMTAMWQFFAGYGIPVYQTTITPWTTSSDSWATLVNQTVTADEPTRVAVNDWIRTTPSPLTGYIEAADAAESSRNSGKWRVDGGAHSTGIHPNNLGHQDIAAGISAAVTSILGAIST